MAVKKIETPEAEVIEPAVEPVDPWNTYREITLPRPAKGEDKDYFVAVNGNAFRVKKGHKVSVPLPIYERLVLIMEAEDAERKLHEEMDGKMVNIGGKDLGLTL